MRMLVGLSRPDSGVAELLAQPVGLGAPVLSRVGVLIDGPAFVPHRSGIANLRSLWSATGRSWPPPALEPALELAGLGEAINRKAKSYSMGMKQRLMLAQALMRDPEVLILDEPANGLDPAEVRALREKLLRVARAGGAVLVSSHQLAEVQLLATHAVVLDQGRLIAAGSIKEMLGAGDAYQIEVDDPVRATAVLAAIPGVSDVTANERTVTVTGLGIESRELVAALVAEGVGISSAQRANWSLEDAFLQITKGGNHAAR